MADCLILHHYPTSPFAEKVRLIFGFKNLPWVSVHIPTIMRSEERRVGKEC